MSSDTFQRPKTARELEIMQGFPPAPDKRPTSSNWDLPPFNRWSFQNMRMLFPTTEVQRGDQKPSTFESADEDLSAVRFQNISGATRDIWQLLDETYTDGFLVYHDGRIVMEHYANDMTPKTLHLSQSLAKTIVGTVAGMLIEQGLVDPEAPLASIVPELAQCGYGDATLTQTLSMQSGVRFTEDYNHPNSDMTRVDIACGWRPAREGSTYESIRDIILSLPKIREHGEVFEYRSIETDVVAWVLERGTSESLAQLTSRLIWQPMGAARDACFNVDREGTALADGGFNATLRDYARFGRLYLDAASQNEGPVSLSWRSGSQLGDASKFGEPYTDVAPNGAYKNKWWVRDVNRGDINARGVFGQLIYLDPASNFMAVKLSTWPDYLIPDFTKDTFLAIDAIRAHLER
ncbi:MAG: serine hydrolase [Paracoccaceae bacterium]